MADSMTLDDAAVPPSTEALVGSTLFDPQLSAWERSTTLLGIAAGQLIGGRYRIERELGEGAWGLVYLATD